MRKWSLLAAFVLFGCGGGSGGGDSGTTPPNPINPGGNTGTNSGDGKGNPATCNDLECMGSDYTRSVLDSKKFVKRCGEGLVMVDDTCGEPRAVITAESIIEFGNTASTSLLFKANIDSKAELAPYLRQKETLPSGNVLQVEYEYFVDGDKEATDRLNLPGVDLSDDRFDNSDGELYYGVPGFDSNPIAMDVTVLGLRFSGTKSYVELRDFCTGFIEKFAQFKPGMEPVTTDLPESFNGREDQNCSAAAYPGNGMERIILYSVCRDAERCLVKDVSIWRATGGV